MKSLPSTILVLILFAQVSLFGAKLVFIDQRDSISPIEYALVLNQRTREIAFSNAKGTLEIPTISGDTLSIQAFGYFPHQHFIGQNLQQKVYLKPTNEILNEVVVLPKDPLLGIIDFPKRGSTICRWAMDAGTTILYHFDTNYQSIWALNEVAIKGKLRADTLALLWIYSDSLGMPHRPLHTNLIRVKANKGRKIVVDLSEYPIITNGEPFFVGIQLIGDPNLVEMKSAYLSLTNKLQKTSTYYRFPEHLFLPGQVDYSWHSINDYNWWDPDDPDSKANLMVKLKYYPMQID
jgi:hypothetical protein